MGGEGALVSLLKEFAYSSRYAGKKLYINGVCVCNRNSLREIAARVW